MKFKGPSSRCWSSIILACFLAAGVCLGPSSAAARSEGPFEGGYYFVDSNEPDCPLYNFEDITQTGAYWQYTGNWQDDAYLEIPIGFTFNFYGVAYNRLFIGTNGYLTFGVGETFWDNYCLGDPEYGADGIPRIAPLFNDLVALGSPQGIYHEVRGTAPNRRLIVEWFMEYQYFSDLEVSSPVVFEVILFEGSDEILFQYQDIVFDDTELDYGAAATVGIGAGDAVNFIDYSCFQASLNDRLAILFGPHPVERKCDETAVNLAFFTATPVKQGVRLDWKTLSEIDNAGFYLLRSEKKKGTYTRMAKLVPARGTATEGAEYSYTDRDVVLQKKYFYKLEAVDNNGKSDFFGPEKAKAGK